MTVVRISVCLPLIEAICDCAGVSICCNSTFKCRSLALHAAIASGALAGGGVKDPFAGAVEANVGFNTACTSLEFALSSEICCCGCCSTCSGMLHAWSTRTERDNESGGIVTAPGLSRQIRRERLTAPMFRSPAIATALADDVSEELNDVSGKLKCPAFHGVPLVAKISYFWRLLSEDTTFCSLLSKGVFACLSPNDTVPPPLDGEPP